MRSYPYIFKLLAKVKRKRKFNLRLLKKISVWLGINRTTVTSSLGRRFLEELKLPHTQAIVPQIK